MLGFADPTGGYENSSSHQYSVEAAVPDAAHIVHKLLRDLLGDDLWYFYYRKNAKILCRKGAL